MSSQQFVDTLTNFRFGYVAHPKTVADILCHRHVMKERVVLKYETYLALTRGLMRNAFVLVLHGARFRHLESGNDAQESSFT